MKKPIILLVIGGFLIIIGIGLSVYGSQLIVENLATDEKQLGIGMSMEISKELEPTINENGVYVIQIPDFKQENHVLVTIFDPSGNTVISKTIDQSPFQEIFKISDSGVYKILVENRGEGEIQVTGVIGYLPQDQSVTVSIFGFIVIIVGLIGLVVGVVYFAKSRKTNIS